VHICKGTRHKGAQKRIKNSKIMDIQTIINDIDIVIEAIKNNNNFDAIAMLKDIQEDLLIINVSQ